MFKIYGLSLLSNALKDNTCFRESVASVSSFCDETFVFVSKSVDGTEKALRENEKLCISILNDPSLKPLQQIREGCEDIPKAWCVALRPDEVLHINDLDILHQDIERAHSLGCEAISFRNLCFVDDPHRIRIDEEVPAHLVRAFRLGSDDFLKSEEEVEIDERVYFSEVRLFNYEELRKVKEGADLKIGKKNTLSYLGAHPSIMKRRVENWGGIWDRIDQAKIYILGERRDYRPEFIEKIKAKKIIWAGNIVEIPAEERPNAIIVKPTVFQKVFRRSKVPTKMKAKEAHPWTPEFFLTLKLSEKGISVN